MKTYIWNNIQIKVLCNANQQNFHLIYGIWDRKYKNITITLQKEQEYPLKLSFCFQISDNIVIHVYIHEHWNVTTRQHSCTEFNKFLLY
jgi:hypothetical protein